MGILEMELEKMICATDPSFIRERGLGCFDHQYCASQVNLNSHGVADIVTVKLSKSKGERYCTVRVYELKRQCIGTSALLQLSGYISAMNTIVSGIFSKSRIRVEVKGCLIGSSVDFNSNFIYLAEMCQVECYLYSIKADGVYFEALDDHYSNDGFDPEKAISQFPVRFIYRSFYGNYEPIDDLPF